METSNKFRIGDKPIPGQSFTLIRRLDDGSSGFGEVWLSHNQFLKQNCVLKFCKDPLDKNQVMSLLNEIEKVKRLKHPGIVQITHEFLLLSTPAIGVEFIDGLDLKKAMEEFYKLTRTNTLSPNTAANLIYRITEIISFCHSQNPPVVHRDLKPTNILVSNYKTYKSYVELSDNITMEHLELKISDFGISSTSPDVHYDNARGTVGKAFNGAGTIAYASPQQLQGENADPSDDLYSIGVIWLEMLTGKAGVLNSKWKRSLADLEMTQEQIDLIESCLELEKEDRISSARLILDRIVRLYRINKEPNNDLIEVLLESVKKANGNYRRLTSLPDITAHSILYIGNPVCNLSGLKRISFTAAEILTPYEGLLDLGSLKEIDEETLVVLAKSKSNVLIISGVKVLSCVAAKALSKYAGHWLILRDVLRFDNNASASLSEATTKNLTVWTHELNDTDAKAFSNYSGDSMAIGIYESCPSQSISILAGSRAKRLSLFGDYEFDSKSALALSFYLGDHLELNTTEDIGFDELSLISNVDANRLTIKFNVFNEDDALAVSGFQGQELELQGFNSFENPEAVQNLVNISNENLSISLKDLEKLEDAEADILATFEGQGISFERLKDPNQYVLQSFSRIKTKFLSLGGIEHLDPEAAKVLSTYRGKQLVLPSIKTLNSNAAIHLSKFPGEKIVFGNSTWLSYKAAQILKNLL